MNKDMIDSLRIALREAHVPAIFASMRLKDDIILRPLFDWFNNGGIHSMGEKQGIIFITEGNSDQDILMVNRCLGYAAKGVMLSYGAGSVRYSTILPLLDGKAEIHEYFSIATNYFIENFVNTKFFDENIATNKERHNAYCLCREHLVHGGRLFLSAVGKKSDIVDWWGLAFNSLIEEMFITVSVDNGRVVGL